MSAVRLLARYLVPSEKQLLRLYRRLIPGDTPQWLEPSLWVVMSALLVVLYAFLL